MKVCVKCRVELHCLKNGVGADFGWGHVYAGDLFVCGVCGMEVIITNAAPMQDSEYKCQDYYVRVKDGGARTVNDSKKKFIFERLDTEWKKSKKQSKDLKKP